MRVSRRMRCGAKTERVRNRIEFIALVGMNSGTKIENDLFFEPEPTRCYPE